jgi:hypothetical protein
MTNDIELFLAPIKTVVMGIIIKHSIEFTGGAIASYDLSVGIVGNLTKYSPNFDVFQIVDETAHDSIMVQKMTQFSSTTSIRLSATSTGDNLDQATQGSVDVWVLTAELS